MLDQFSASWSGALLCQTRNNAKGNQRDFAPHHARPGQVADRVETQIPACVQHRHPIRFQDRCRPNEAYALLQTARGDQGLPLEPEDFTGSMKPALLEITFPVWVRQSSSCSGRMVNPATT